jgi:hypothetical protein
MGSSWQSIGIRYKENGESLGTAIRVFVSVIGRPPTALHIDLVRCPPSKRRTPYGGSEERYWRDAADVEP